MVRNTLADRYQKCCIGMQKNERSRVRARQQVFVFRLHRFTGMAFFVYTQGVVGEGFRQKGFTLCAPTPPL